jgi:PAS domain S-box-containing protein
MVDRTSTLPDAAEHELAVGRVDAIFTAAPIGLGFWGTDLRYERVNEALAAMNGRPAAEHVGRTVHEVLGEHGPHVAGLLQEALSTGRPVLDVPLRSGQVVTDAGDERFWEASYFPLPGATGEPIGVGAVVREVTRRRRAEQERDDLLRQALTSRAVAEATQLRVEAALREAEEARAQAEAARRRTDVLARAGMRLAASIDYERTLGEVARSAVPDVADWCSITLRRPDGALQTVATVHRDRERERIAAEVTTRYPPQPEDPVGAPRVIRTGQIELLQEISDADVQALTRDPEHALLLRALGLRTTLVVPLHARGRTLGALTLVLGDATRRFDDGDVTLARALAARAALHIDNARLYSERSHIAHTLQRSLLPARLPHVPGLDVAARYSAAGDENEVGGDFYDLFPLGGARWQALIGDVSGKGPEAAAVTSLARHTLRAAAMHGLEPAESLAFLNRALLAAGDSARVLTAVCAEVTATGGGADVTLAVGGHPAPLVQRAGGEVEEIRSQGTLLGALDEVIVEHARVRLHPGDLLLLCTDGVTEFRGPDPLAGLRAVTAVLERTAGEEAQAVLREVERAALALHTHGPRDDLALLALRVPPPT